MAMQDIESRLRTIEDRNEIHDLIMRYTLGLDTADPDLYASVFTEDAHLNVAGLDFYGHKPIKEMLVGIRAKQPLGRVPDPHGYIFGAVRHVCTNLMMDIKGDTAKVESYCVEIASSGRNEKGQGLPQRIINVCRYQDDLVRQNGKWLIKKRLIIGDLYGKLPELDMNVYPHTAHPSEMSP